MKPTRTIPCLLGILLSPLASQSQPTSKPQKPDDATQKAARRWVTFLELDDRWSEAADALLKLGPKAVPALLQALDDPHPVVTQRVCHILRFGAQATAAKERLIALSRSKDPKLAAAANYALLAVQPVGLTLVPDAFSHKVLELDKTGKVVRTLTGVNGPWDAERLPNGHYLVCGCASRKVVEMTAQGKVVWSFAKLRDPQKAQRLGNGNTLVVDHGNGVLEVDRAGKVVWKYTKAKRAFDAERLVNGNTLIVDHGNERIIEVTSADRIVWQHKYGPGPVFDADRLPNGNTLITLSVPGKVIEVTRKGKVVWELTGLRRPRDADRLPNGHTLVAQGGEVTEYDAGGEKVWSFKSNYATEANRY